MIFATLAFASLVRFDEKKGMFGVQRVLQLTGL
jgi:hypothetical protein